MKSMCDSAKTLTVVTARTVAGSGAPSVKEISPTDDFGPSDAIGSSFSASSKACSCSKYSWDERFQNEFDVNSAQQAYAPLPSSSLSKPPRSKVVSDSVDIAAQMLGTLPAQLGRAHRTVALLQRGTCQAQTSCTARIQQSIPVQMLWPSCRVQCDLRHRKWSQPHRWT